MTRALRLLVLCGAILAVTGTVASWTYRKQVEIAEHSTLQALSTIRDLKVDAVAEWRASLLADGDLVRSAPPLVDAALRPGRHERHDASDVLNWVRPNFARRDYVAVQLVEPGSDAGLDAVLVPLIENARSGAQTNRSVLSPLYKDGSGAVRLAVIGPVVVEGAATGHVVVLTVDPTRTLFQMIQRWPTSSTSGETLLVVRDGDDVVYLNELRHLPAPSLSLRRPLSPSLAAALALTDVVPRPGGKTYDYRGVEVIASWSRVRESDWGIVTKVDASEVYAPLAIWMWLIWIGAGGSVAVGVFATLWLFERREASRMRAARRTEDQLAMASRAGSVGLWDLDVESDTVSLNSECRAQLGYSEGDPVWSVDEWQQRLHPDDRDRALDTFRRYASNPWPEYCLEFRLLHRDGTYRHFVARAEGQFVDGRLVRMIGCTVDITPIKTLEAQFHQAQKMEAVGRLAGGVAHDFNNLLTVVTGYVELLLDEALSPNVRQDLLEVQRAAKSAERLTRQLLVFSRTSQLQSEITDVNTLLSDWQKLLGRALGDDITVQLDLCDGTATVALDAEHLEQTIMNLAVNARDAMPRGGSLTLKTRLTRLERPLSTWAAKLQPGDYVVIDVQDTGTGIPEKVLPHIFEPFYTTKDASKGTGLGLATVQSILTGCDGAICVSTSPAGTTFSLYFPLRRGACPAPPQLDRGHRPCGTAKRVLIVDDDESVRNVVAREAERAGYLVQSSDAISAFALMENGAVFDVLVTDVVMPTVSGTELAHRLRMLQPWLKVIFMTGYLDSEIGVPVPRDATTLRKPLRQGALVEALESASSQRPEADHAVRP